MTALKLMRQHGSLEAVVTSLLSKTKRAPKTSKTPASEPADASAAPAKRKPRARRADAAAAAEPVAAESGTLATDASARVPAAFRDASVLSSVRSLFLQPSVAHVDTADLRMGRCNVAALQQLLVGKYDFAKERTASQLDDILLLQSAMAARARALSLPT